MNPRLTICICTYNRYNLIDDAIRSILKQNADENQYKVLVIDNSPDHVHAAEFGANYSSYPIVDYRIEYKVGLSNARNVGINQCGTELIAFLDDDAVASLDWVNNLLLAFDTFGPSVAVVGGCVEPLWEIPRPTWLADGLLGYVTVVDWGGEMRYAKPNEWFAGANIAFRTSVAMAMGGFNENLGRMGEANSLLSNEESELTNRILKTGHSAVYAPKASVKHWVGKNRLNQSWFRKRVAWQAVSDCLAYPSQTRIKTEQARGWLNKNFARLPKNKQGIPSLEAYTDSPLLFSLQLEAINFNMLLQLSGYISNDAHYINTINQTSY